VLSKFHGLVQLLVVEELKKKPTEKALGQIDTIDNPWISELLWNLVDMKFSF